MSPAMVSPGHDHSSGDSSPPQLLSSSRSPAAGSVNTAKFKSVPKTVHIVPESLLPPTIHFPKPKSTESKAPLARTTADKTMVAVEDRHGFIENGDIDVDGCEVKKEPEEEEVKQEDTAEPQVWRLFSRIRKTVPETQRLENLTWRMTAMTLHKKQDGKQEEKLASTINAADIAVGPPRAQ
ncbi:hypothetical protein BGZ98_008465 [Dissophora globulifera]|nr:hypothetical protein BGZ98_008465 [Dissophora globulifera]